MSRERPLWVLLAAVVALFWRPLTTSTFFFRDLYQLFYPKKEFLVAALRSGQIPMWDPLTNGGQPFLASPTNTAFYPSNALFFVLPFRFAFNLDLVLHVLLCAAGAYWLARTLRLSPTAAFVSGAAFALCGYTVSAINLSLPIHAMPWVPIAIALLRRSPIAAGIAASMPIFAGSAELTAMLFITMIVFDRKAVRSALLAIAIAVGVSLIQTIPAAEVIANSSRAHRRSYEAFTMWSVDPRRLPELIVPRFFGPTGTLFDPDYWGRQRESRGFPYILSIYFGVPLLVLAAIGARSHKTLATLAAAGLLLSLGKFLPGFSLLYHVPFVATFRYPVKFLMIALLPIALLAGIAVDSVMKRRTIFVAAALAIIAFLCTRFIFELSPVQWTQMNWSVAQTLVGAIAISFAIFFANRAAIAAIVVIDLFLAAYPVNAYAPRSIFDPPPLATRVRDVAGPMRFYRANLPMDFAAPSNEIFWLARRNIELLAGYTATMFGIATVFHADYDGLAPSAISQLSEGIDRIPWDRRVQLLRVAGVRVFIDRGTLHTIPEASLAWFEGPCAGEVRLTKREINSSSYMVNASCPGHVVFAETDYPGWRVTIDGRPTLIERANIAFSAIRVPAGSHTILRTYEPRIWIAGIAGTLLTVLAIIAASTRSRRRPPSAAPSH